MPFTVQSPGKIKSRDPVCVSVQRHGGGPKIMFSFSTQLVRDLGWKLGDHIEVAVGEGSDTGLVRFRLAPTGYVVRKAKSSTRLQVLLNYWGSEAPISMLPAEGIPNTIGKALTIRLPWVARLRSVA